MTDFSVKHAARNVVLRRVKSGLLPHPNLLPCTDCGHVYVSGGGRHEYDHFMGYEKEHQCSVQAVCKKCHGERTSRENGMRQRNLLPDPKIIDDLGGNSEVVIANIIKRLRTHRLSQAYIAERTGMSQAMISRWANGLAPSSANAVLRLLALVTAVESTERKAKP